MPAIFTALYFATLALTGGVWWMVHMWAGAIARPSDQAQDDHQRQRRAWLADASIVNHYPLRLMW